MKRFELDKNKVITELYEFDQDQETLESVKDVEMFIGVLEDDSFEGCNVSIYFRYKNGVEELYLEHDVKYDFLVRDNYIVKEIDVIKYCINCTQLCGLTDTCEYNKEAHANMIANDCDLYGECEE